MRCCEVAGHHGDRAPDARLAVQEAVEAQLSEVQPLIESAQRAVGSLKAEHLSEVRSLKAPPAAIRDVLEAVLRLMGQTDTSWNAMKRFLATSGVKDKIMAFDAAAITPAAASSVEGMLQERAESFDAERIYRVSVAAAPLAEWVKVRLPCSFVPCTLWHATVPPAEPRGFKA